MLLFAGKDGVNGGSWLGFSRKGRFAVLTNYRKDFNAPEFQGISRGGCGLNGRGLYLFLLLGTLVLDYLLGETTPTNYSSVLMSNSAQYDGFNLITGTLGYVSMWVLSWDVPLFLIGITKKWYIAVTVAMRGRVPLWVESMASVTLRWTLLG